MKLLSTLFKIVNYSNLFRDCNRQARLHNSHVHYYSESKFTPLYTSSTGRPIASLPEHSDAINETNNEQASALLIRLEKDVSRGLIRRKAAIKKATGVQG